MSLESEITRCKHAQWRPSEGCDWCLEANVPCTGSFDDVLFGPSEMDCFEPLCLWEVYQADQSFENMTHWLKHRAWVKMGAWFRA